MNPKSTALILVGYQNDYFAANGILRGVVEDPNRVDSVLANSLAFIRAMIPTPMAIIATPIVLEPDYRALAKNNPVRIDQENLAVGRQRAENLRRILAEHAVGKQANLA